MRLRHFAIFLAFCCFALFLRGDPEPSSWPVSLRDGLPASLPGWAAKDEFPELDENQIGKYVEVSRFFQRIESATSAQTLRLAVQDYDGKDAVGPIRDAIAQARKSAGVEVREFDAAGHKGYAVTDRSGGQLATLVTVVVMPSRLVLAQAANLSGEDAIALVKRVDFTRIAAVRKH